jgi:hypothetical protein
MPRAQAATATAPNPIAMLFHVFKSISLAVSLLVDPRVHPARKAVFITVVGALIAAAIGVEGVGEAVTQLLNVVPGLGVFLGVGEIPADFVIDWVLVAAAMFNLLRLFPREIVGEHYDRLFRSK